MRKPIQPKKVPIAPIILPLFLVCGGGLEASILFMETFETDGLGLRYEGWGVFTDGADDYFIRTDGFTEASGIPAFTGFGGSHFWAAEDVDATENPGALAMLDFAGIDLAGASAVSFSIDIGAGSGSAFDFIDDFVLLQYRVDAGAWQTALAFQNNGQTYNGPLLNDTDFDGIGDQTELGLALQTVSSPVIPLSGSTMDLRIDLLMTSGSEEVAFDNITVTGVAVPEPSHAVLAIALAALLAARGRRFPPRRGN
ncbi:MAG: hypothetical protein ACP5I4_04680 [Oceanipulchritudo sp.]|jgi:hypothetical protein